MSAAVFGIQRFSPVTGSRVAAARNRDDGCGSPGFGVWAAPARAQVRIDSIFQASGCALKLQIPTVQGSDRISALAAAPPKASRRLRCSTIWRRLPLFFPDRSLMLST